MTTPRDARSWMVVARLELGQHELPGTEHNPRILAYHQATTLRATADEIPWCSAFVNWVLAQVGMPGTRSAAARSWLLWGSRLVVPRIGCITVLRRGSSSWQGHVGFYEGTAPSGRVLLLAGNQANAVTVAGCDPAKVLGYRWPKEPDAAP